MKRFLNNGPITVLMIILLSAFGCDKDPGFGGSAVVIGKIKTISYNSDFSVPKDTQFAADKEVYIQFGNQITWADREDTNYDGSFQFSGLKKGDYKIFSYSEDSTFSQSNDDLAEIVEFEITENSELLDLGEIVLINNNFNNSNSKIQGHVKVMNFNSSWTTLLDTYYAQNEEVYLIEGEDLGYTERVRTSFDGSFEFGELCTGMYQVYIYGDDSTGQAPSGIAAVIDTVYITNNNQTILLEELIKLD